MRRLRREERLLLSRRLLLRHRVVVLLRLRIERALRRSLERSRLSVLRRQMMLMMLLLLRNNRGWLRRRHLLPLMLLVRRFLRGGAVRNRRGRQRRQRWNNRLMLRDLLGMLEMRHKRVLRWTGWPPFLHRAEARRSGRRRATLQERRQGRSAWRAAAAVEPDWERGFGRPGRRRGASDTRRCLRRRLRDSVRRRHRVCCDRVKLRRLGDLGVGRLGRRRRVERHRRRGRGRRGRGSRRGKLVLVT